MSERRHPTPWRLEISGGPTVTVLDANGDIILPLGEMECGWTDTSTGNYVDPESEIDVMRRIVSAINNQSAILEYLEYACNILERAPRLSDLDTPGNPGETSSVVRSARAAIAKALGDE